MRMPNCYYINKYWSQITRKTNQYNTVTSLKIIHIILRFVRGFRQKPVRKKIKHVDTSTCNKNKT